DFGGSLRIPASFCSVVGFRPTPGVVPRGPASQPFSHLWVDGPIARDVADCALMLDAMSGYDGRDPLSRPRPAESFLETTMKDPPPGLRIAFSHDLGITPVDPAVEAVFSALTGRLSDIATVVEEAHPNLKNAPGAFQTLRAAWLAADMSGMLETHEKKLKPELVWNIRKGMELSADDIGHANIEQGRTYREIRGFFDNFDFLVTPATVVPPFDRDCRYPEEVDGKKLKTYFDWLAITYAISLTSCPAMSVPMGFTDNGLPVGVQIIAPPFAEADLFRAAAALEGLLEIDNKLPVNPGGRAS
ncbi:MAG: amidase family protein, partial [Rhodospirillales bacterium]